MFALARLETYIENNDGLYWDLLNWAKNAQDKLDNKTGNIFINIDNIYNNMEIFEIREEKHIDLWKVKYKNPKESKKLIFTALNTFFNIDVNYKTFSSIQVFLVNYEGSDLSVDKEIFCDDIFFTEKGARDYISEKKEWDKVFKVKYNYFIEKIVLTKKVINNVRFIS
ncbi:MAG: hypothetical protein LBV17_04075 [Treponema sp.]|nr:hypothetical protein [Treponema sp.]